MKDGRLNSLNSTLRNPALSHKWWTNGSAVFTHGRRTVPLIAEW